MSSSGSPPVATDAGTAASDGPVEYRQFRFQLLPDATEVILVRHGETMPARRGERFDLLDGHGDPPLGPDGLRQADDVGRHLCAEGEIDAIYVTNLRRTVETAAPLASALGLEPVVEARLREIYLGEWEGGLYRQHMAEGHPLAGELVRQERWDVVPGAESNEAFSERLSAAIGDIAERHRGRRVVAFSHGGAIGMLLAIASGSRPFSFVASDNGSISRIVVTPHSWLVRGYNEVTHLT